MIKSWFFSSLICTKTPFQGCRFQGQTEFFSAAKPGLIPPCKSSCPQTNSSMRNPWAGNSRQVLWFFSYFNFWVKLLGWSRGGSGGAPSDAWGIIQCQDQSRAPRWEAHSTISLAWNVSSLMGIWFSVSRLQVMLLCVRPPDCQCCAGLRWPLDAKKWLNPAVPYYERRKNLGFLPVWLTGERH